ncbi:hypothetical protein HYH03_004740 [Edaphochlamys debaryana]|uniref:Uncharacterized protein n=1 Tax=Edaphochlamys debaryana TaxID=47281 RepID=A0A835YE67_9CHLO|nr:hypothetical protein HYH03_004740 [Edaphochlamys debaryana]|eukprot:KAG2497150.1 hypothetical protein HYH03_004740 [Edaphochlamys debaryana]
MGALLRDGGGGSDLGRLPMLAAQPQGSGAASAGRLRDPPGLGGAPGAGAGGVRSAGALEALAPSLPTSRVAPPPARTEALLGALLRSELGGRQELGAGVGPSGPWGQNGGNLEEALLQALLGRELGPGGPSEAGSGLPSTPPPQAQQRRTLDHHPTRDEDSAAAVTGSAQPALAPGTAAAPRPAPPAPAPPPSAEAAQAELISGLLGSSHLHLPAGAVLDALVPATRDLLD